MFPWKSQNRFASYHCLWTFFALVQEAMNKRFENGGFPKRWRKFLFGCTFLKLCPDKVKTRDIVVTVIHSCSSTRTLHLYNQYSACFNSCLTFTDGNIRNALSNTTKSRPREKPWVVRHEHLKEKEQTKHSWCCAVSSFWQLRSGPSPSRGGTLDQILDQHLWFGLCCTGMDLAGFVWKASGWEQGWPHMFFRLTELTRVISECRFCRSLYVSQRERVIFSTSMCYWTMTHSEEIQIGWYSILFASLADVMTSFLVGSRCEYFTAFGRDQHRKHTSVCNLTASTEHQRIPHHTRNVSQRMHSPVHGGGQSFCRTLSKESKLMTEFSNVDIPRNAGNLSCLALLT